MGVRQFADGDGVVWTVWETEASRIHPKMLSDTSLGAFRQGWLTFDANHELRRLAPYPPNWSTLPDEELRRLCLMALTMRRRVSPADGQEEGEKRERETDGRSK